MPRHHHVNLGVPPGLAEAEGDFLTGILGYRRVDLTPEIAAMGAIWYEDEQGHQVHLSVDPNHRPAERAHTAVEIDDPDLAVERLRASGAEIRDIAPIDRRIIFCEDPAGNRWELRSTLPV